MSKKVSKATIGFWGTIISVGMIGSAINANNVTTKEEYNYEKIACEYEEKEDPELEKGQTKIELKCQDGKVKITEKVTYKGNEPIEREEISRTVETEPQKGVKLIGTKEIPEETETQTTPSYSTQSQTTTGTQKIDYSNEMQHGYCKDGTPAYGNPHAKGRANVCYGHKGWVGN